MTRKDYILLAGAIRKSIIGENLGPFEKHRASKIINNIIEVLEQDNELFNRYKFIDFIFKDSQYNYTEGGIRE